VRALEGLAAPEARLFIEKLANGVHDARSTREV
jgi:hypothetical protein